jgi:hypothetical protein
LPDGVAKIEAPSIGGVFFILAILRFRSSMAQAI